MVFGITKPKRIAELLPYVAAQMPVTLHLCLPVNKEHGGKEREA